MVVAIRFSDTDKHCSVVPVSELITADHSVDKVGNWFRKTKLFYTKLLNRWPIFSRIITDFSFVNLNAINNEFNNMSLIEYMEYCYSVLVNGKPPNSNIITINLCCAAHIKLKILSMMFIPVLVKNLLRGDY